MSILKDSVTRDISFFDDPDGHFFTISEGGRTLFKSEYFQTPEECCKEGMRMMDQLHEVSPLHSDYTP